MRTETPHQSSHLKRRELIWSHWNVAALTLQEVMQTKDSPHMHICSLYLFEFRASCLPTLGRGSPRGSLREADALKLKASILQQFSNVIIV
jgi:hypothetical protein